MTAKFKTIILLFLVISTGLCLWISFQMHKTKVEKDKKELTSQINQLFQSKDVIADGQKIEITGDLYKRHYSLLSGGFSIYELSKESGGFVKSAITAGDIDYKEDEYEYSYGYRMPTYRQTPDECYTASFEFLLNGSKDNRKKSYTENTYTEIKDFPAGFNKDFYFISAVEHPTELYFAQILTGKVYTSSREIAYSTEKTYYAIQNNKKAIQKSLIKFLLMGFAIALILTSIIYLILRFLIPIASKGDNILNKKWKDIQENYIMTIEPHLFGKHKVTVVENEKVKKGIAKFSENGTQLDLSLPDTELFYKIILTEENKLEVENMTTNKIICFEKLGTNAYKKDEKAYPEEKKDTSSTETE